ncbi:hypothetical protein G7Y89_g12043 [Cudoniella acicularis]|uniref:Uncharacterized protein n=1 Tax=Cudoniella acicularis TaxID=354080 RepID=A0A8H4RCL0_9HELO|nr:hypothetical protein G7Y89_g12043 [Cudoniella acicularis]
MSYRPESPNPGSSSNPKDDKGSRPKNPSSSHVTSSSDRSTGELTDYKELKKRNKSSKSSDRSAGDKHSRSSRDRKGSRPTASSVKSTSSSVKSTSSRVKSSRENSIRASKDDKEEQSETSFSRTFDAPGDPSSQWLSPVSENVQYGQEDPISFAQPEKPSDFQAADRRPETWQVFGNDYYSLPTQYNEEGTPNPDAVLSPTGSGKGKMADEQSSQLFQSSYKSQDRIEIAEDYRTDPITSNYQELSPATAVPLSKYLVDPQMPATEQGYFGSALPSPQYHGLQILDEPSTQPPTSPQGVSMTTTGEPFSSKSPGSKEYRELDVLGYDLRKPNLTAEEVSVLSLKSSSRGHTSERNGKRSTKSSSNTKPEKVNPRTDLKIDTKEESFTLGEQGSLTEKTHGRFMDEASHRNLRRAISPVSTSSSSAGVSLPTSPPPYPTARKSTTPQQPKDPVGNLPRNVTAVVQKPTINREEENQTTREMDERYDKLTGQLRATQADLNTYKKAHDHVSGQLRAVEQSKIRNDNLIQQLKDRIEILEQGNHGHVEARNDTSEKLKTKDQELKKLQLQERRWQKTETELNARNSEIQQLKRHRDEQQSAAEDLKGILHTQTEENAIQSAKSSMEIESLKKKLRDLDDEKRNSVENKSAENAALKKQVRTLEEQLKVDSGEKSVKFKELELQREQWEKERITNKTLRKKLQDFEAEKSNWAEFRSGENAALKEKVRALEKQLSINFEASSAEFEKLKSQKEQWEKDKITNKSLQEDIEKMQREVDNWKGRMAEGEKQWTEEQTTLKRQLDKLKQQRELWKQDTAASNDLREQLEKSQQDYRLGDDELKRLKTQFKSKVAALENKIKDLQSQEIQWRSGEDATCKHLRGQLEELQNERRLDQSRVEEYRVRWETMQTKLSEEVQRLRSQEDQRKVRGATLSTQLEELRKEKQGLEATGADARKIIRKLQQDKNQLEAQIEAIQKGSAVWEEGSHVTNQQLTEIRRQQKLWVIREGEMKQKIEEMQQKQATSEANQLHANQQIERLQRERNRLASEKSEVDKQLEELRGQKSEGERKLSALQELKVDWTTEKNKLLNEIQALQSKGKTKQSDLEKQVQNLRNLLSEQTAWKEKFDRIAIEKIELKAQIERLDVQVRHLEQSKQILDANREESDSKIEGLQLALSTCHSEKTASENQAVELQNQLSKASAEKKESDQREDRLKKQRHVLNLEIQTLQQKQEQETAEKSILETKIMLLQKQQQQENADWATKTSELNNQIDVLKQQERQRAITKVDSQRKSGELQSLAAEKRTLEEKLENWQQQQRGWATTKFALNQKIIELESQRNQEQASQQRIGELQQELQTIRDNLDQKEQELLSKQCETQNLQGQLYDQNQERLRRVREMHDIEQRSAGIQKQIVRLSLSHSEEKAAWADKENQMRNQLRQDMDAVKKKLQAQEQDSERLRGRIDELESEIDLSRQKAHGNAPTKICCQLKLNHWVEEKEELRNTIQKLQLEKNELSSRLDEAENNLKISQARLQEGRDELKKQFFELNEREQRLLKQDLALKEQKDRGDSLSGKLAKFEGEVGALKKEVLVLSSGKARGTTLEEHLQSQIDVHVEEIKNLHQNLGAQEEKIKRVQEAVFEIDKKANREVIEDKMLEKYIRKGVVQPTNEWSYNYVLQNADTNNLESVSPELRDDLRKMTRKIEESNSELKKGLPRIILNTLLAHYIAEHVFKHPFFILHKGNQIVSFEQMQQLYIHQDEAYAWRVQTLDLISRMQSPYRPRDWGRNISWAEKQVKEFQSKHCDDLASNFINGPARSFLKPSRGDTRRRELAKVIQAAGWYSSVLWKQCTTLKILEFQDVKGKPFFCKSENMELDRVYRLDAGESGKDGDDIMIVVQPGFVAIDNEDGQMFPKEKVWSKAVVF